MNQIKPYSVWVGHAGDARAIKTVLDQQIRAIVQLAAEEMPVQAPRDLVLLRFPLIDGVGNDPEILYLAIHCVATLIEKRMPTLVSCGAGLSRSPVITAAALAVARHGTLDECVKLVARYHAADVLPGFWEDVRQVLKVHFSQVE